LLLFICGIISIFLGSLMAFPAIVDFFAKQPENGENFLICAFGVAFLGALISALSYRKWNRALNKKEMFVITSCIWFLASIIGAIPFYFSDQDLSITDVFFESVSGLTTTGSTILAHIDSMPKGFLLWRSMLQWLGGIGIIVLAITILPILRIGGMQLFSTESSDSSEKDSPFVASKLKRYIYAYLFVSCLCVWALYVGGMDLFNAVAHMMTCLSTGGFSTHDTSIAFYHSPLIEWILIFFMTIGGLPLAVIVAFLEGKWFKLKENEQVKTFLLTCFTLCTIIPVCMRIFMPPFNDIFDTIRTFTFHFTSIITTTGYVTENYTLWGPFFVVFFVFLTAVGSCTGSTSGGIKFFRFSILASAIKRHLTLMISPHAVIIPKYNNKPITEDVWMGVMSFMSIFCATTIVTTLCLSLTGLDFTTSFSGALSSVANVGPGIGNTIGPDKSFFLLPDAAKWILSFAMILGRLEFMTVIVLLLPKLWKKN